MRVVVLVAQALVPSGLTERYRDFSTLIREFRARFIESGPYWQCWTPEEGRTSFGRKWK